MANAAPAERIARARSECSPSRARRRAARPDVGERCARSVPVKATLSPWEVKAPDHSGRCLTFGSASLRIRRPAVAQKTCQASRLGGKPCPAPRRKTGREGWEPSVAPSRAKEWLGKTPGLRKPVSGWRCRAARLPGVRRAAAIRDARVSALHHGFLDPDAVRQRRGRAWLRRERCGPSHTTASSRPRSFPELKESLARL